MPEKRVTEIHEPLLVLTFETLHEVLGIRIQDLSTTNFKQRLGTKTAVRKVQDKLEHRLEGLLLAEVARKGFVSNVAAVIDGLDPVTKSQFSEVRLMCCYSPDSNFGP